VLRLTQASSALHAAYDKFSQRLAHATSAQGLAQSISAHHVAPATNAIIWSSPSTHSIKYPVRNSAGISSILRFPVFFLTHSRQAPGEHQLSPRSLPSKSFPIQHNHPTTDGVIRDTETSYIYENQVRANVACGRNSEKAPSTPLHSRKPPSQCMNINEPHRM
jgi:hypothetical protein